MRAAKIMKQAVKLEAMLRVRRLHLHSADGIGGNAPLICSMTMCMAGVLVRPLFGRNEIFSWWICHATRFCTLTSCQGQAADLTFIPLVLKGFSDPTKLL
jgi:hypothetical protein